MDQEPTKEEIDQRAREIARRLMSTPYQRQDWPKVPSDRRQEQANESRLPKRKK
jgi:hypothetical protein